MTATTVTEISVLGRGNVNAFLVRGRKAVLVDTGTPGAAPKIQAALAQHGVGASDVSAIVVTHGHIDHFGSAAVLRQALGAPIIAHHGDADAYASGHNLAPSIQPTGPFGWLFAKLPAARERTEPFVADIVVDESMSLHDYGVDAQILFTPGHTPGSISVLTEAGELIAADLIAGRFLGAIRRTPANPPFHHDRAQNLASLSAVLALNPAVLYVGHGGPLDPSRVWRWAEREHRKARPRSASQCPGSLTIGMRVRTGDVWSRGLVRVGGISLVNHADRPGVRAPVCGTGRQCIKRIATIPLTRRSTVFPSRDPPTNKESYGKLLRRCAFR